VLKNVFFCFRMVHFHKVLNKFFVAYKYNIRKYNNSNIIIQNFN